MYQLTDGKKTVPLVRGHEYTCHKDESNGEYFVVNETNGKKFWARSRLEDSDDEALSTYYKQKLRDRPKYPNLNERCTSLMTLTI